MDELCKTTMPPLNQTFPLPPLIDVNASLLIDVCHEYSTEAKYSGPMVSIGYYIMGASLLCIALIHEDLVSGVKKKKFWFPAVFFPLNSFSITIMAVAIKLPMDLSSSMPHLVDQSAKIGSLGFLCTMISHLTPSVGSITNNRSNVAALSLLVVTLIVNVGIQLKTGVISNGYLFMTITCIYMGMLLLLLIILLYSSREIAYITDAVESKYQAILTDQFPHENLIYTLEELRQHVKRYWIMAQTGTPQFVMTSSSPLFFASVIISAISTAMQLLVLTKYISFYHNKDVIATSVYAASMVGIFGSQVAGSLLGLTVSILRCFLFLKFKLLANQNMNLSNDDTDRDLSKYVLLLKHNVSITKYSVTRSLDSLDSLIQNRGQRRQVIDVVKLLEKSASFDGVETFDIDQIPSLLSVEPVNSWSLPITSLLCIAVGIPSIDKRAVLNLCKGVSKGKYYIDLVEVHLNMETVIFNSRRASIALWHDVESDHKWFGNPLGRSPYIGKTPKEILELFAHTSKEIVNEFNRSTDESPPRMEDLPLKVIAANSMYRVAQTIMHTYESNNLEILDDELFSRLSTMIADILAACLTNIPRVIIKKCHQSEIEKRENSVTHAILLLEEASDIIERLQTRELPNMDPTQMAYIDKWRLYYKQPQNS